MELKEYEKNERKRPDLDAAAAAGLKLEYRAAMRTEIDAEWGTVLPNTAGETVPAKTPISQRPVRRSA